MAMTNLDTWLTRRMGWSGNSTPSTQDLRHWQMDALRTMVSFAQANSPFYGRLLKSVDAPAISTFGDFASLPTITPDDVRAKPEDLLCVSQDEIARIVTLQTSGTTGTPKRVFYTEDDLEATRDYFHWGMSNLIGSGQTAFVLMPGERPGGVGRLLVDALERAGARAVPHGVMEDSEVALDHCLQEKATCIVGPASHVNMLACAWERRGLPKDRIQSVLLCWDAAPDAVVKRVSKALDCQVFRHWGMIETGLGGAVECTPGSGMHLRETDVFVEILDPDTGRLMPDGEFGELVVTTPLKRGMPLIRYRTGDRGRLLPGACECNSPLRRLDTSISRMDGGIKLPNGTLDISELNEVLFSTPGVEDFAASYADETLMLRICSINKTTPKNIRKDLATIPVVGLNTNVDKLRIDIDVCNNTEPAIPGLAKRRIMRSQGI